jgi:hypothetical protein
MKDKHLTGSAMALSTGWEVERRSLYDEEGVEGWAWIAPDGKEFVQIGSWNELPPWPDEAQSHMEALSASTTELRNICNILEASVKQLLDASWNGPIDADHPARSHAASLLAKLKTYCLSTSLFSNLRNCKEVLVSSSPIDRLDAKEPRTKVIVTGPTRLLSQLVNALTADMPKDPESGKNIPQPSLGQKWELGHFDRGHGRGSYAVIVGEMVIAECASKEIAEHIIESHNATVDNFCHEELARYKFLMADGIYIINQLESGFQETEELNARVFKRIAPNPPDFMVRLHLPQYLHDASIKFIEKWKRLQDTKPV